MKPASNYTASERLSLSFPGNKYFWLLSFVYSTCMALMVQKLFLPMWPAMHAGHGLLKGDAIIFHEQAVQIAQQIQLTGWSSWSLFPPGGSANVGVLSALYALLSPDPAWFIPFNAAAHATGALLIYRLGSALTTSDSGRLGGLLAAICFLAFPSALLWYGQIHKDAFTIAGTLLVLDTWLAIDRDGKLISLFRFFQLIMLVFLGAVLVGVFRPYHVLLILFGLFISLILILPYRDKMVVTFTRAVIVLVVALTASMFTSVSSPSNDYVYGANSASEEFQWQESPLLPPLLDKALHRASELRQHFVDYGISVGAESGIDSDTIPHNAQDAIKYLPRALFVGLFSPFPDTWGERMSVPRLVAAMETAVWYLITLGALATLMRFRNRNLFAGIVFCATILTVIAYVSPNVGTLYRLRYGLWFFYALIGSVGWASIILDHLPGAYRASPVNRGKIASHRSTASETQSIVHKSGSGPVVMLLALVLFVGFLTRDLLLVGKFGFTDEVDLFFAISAISMFFVNSLSVPLGDAFVPLFVGARRLEDAERVRLLKVSLGFAVLLLFFAWMAIELFAPLLVKMVLGSHSLERQADAVFMLRWFSVLVLLSSFTVIGNAVLNSLGRPIQAAQAQLIVPFLTLTAVIIAPKGDAVYAAIAGMVIGTFGNALIVGWRVRSLGYSFLPIFPNKIETQVLRSQYWPLLAAAVLPALLVPLNYYFAASTGSGTLSAWAISSKIVTLFASLANVVATSVILPRLSYAFSDSHNKDMHHQANFLVATGVWLGGVLMLGGFMFVRPICVSILSLNLKPDQIEQLVGIITIGLVQIPMTISSAMFNRLVVASGRSIIVLQAAILAFAGNVLADILLVPGLGVLGVAIGALIGTSLSAVLVLANAYKSTGLTLQELLVALASWLIWIALCASLFLRNTDAISIFGILLLGAATLQFRSVKQGNENVVLS